LRRAISACCAVACSSRRITMIWPARSTTAAAVLKPFDLHSAMVPSAMAFAIASDKLRCVTSPCEAAGTDNITAMPTTANALIV
jgi:hypothetical protein